MAVWRGPLRIGSLDSTPTRCTQPAVPGYSDVTHRLLKTQVSLPTVPQLTNSAAPVLLGYEPLLEGGTLRLIDLLLHHSTSNRVALAPPPER